MHFCNCIITRKITAFKAVNFQLEKVKTLLNVVVLQIFGNLHPLKVGNNITQIISYFQR